jgi:hypothetical protein
MENELSKRRTGRKTAKSRSGLIPFQIRIPWPSFPRLCLVPYSRDPRKMPMTRRTTVYGTLVPLNKYLQAVPRTSEVPAKITASTGLESFSAEYEEDAIAFSGDLYGNAAPIILVISGRKKQTINLSFCQ